MKKIMTLVLLCLISFSTVVYAQEKQHAQPLKEGEKRNLYQLDPRPFDPATEPNSDMFMRHNGESEMRITNGNLKEWQILLPLKGDDPAYPEERGHCTTRTTGVNYAVLAPGLKTEPERLLNVQKLIYIAYGSGEVVSGSQREQFEQNAMVLVSLNSTYTIENTGGRDLVMYVFLDPVPDGFKPRPDIFVMHCNERTFMATGGGHWTHATRGATITREHGLATITHMAPVWYLPMTIGQPHSHNPGIEEIWFVVEGDFHLLLGKQFYNLIPGTAYKVPPTGNLSHSNMNLGTKPLRTVWMMYSTPTVKGQYRYGTLEGNPPSPDESNPDMYISSYKEHYFKTVHSFLERDMLAKNNTKGARPIERGNVLNYIDRFTHATIVGHQKTQPITLKDTQEVYYIISGNGTITGVGRTYDLYPGACALVPAGLEFVIENPNDDMITMYLVSEKVTAGFTPNKSIIVKDENTVPVNHRSHWTYESRLLFQRQEGLSQLQNVAMVVVPPNSFAQPHSHNELTEEVWSTIDSELMFMLGKNARAMPEGYCYMVPPDGKSFHANINTTGKPIRTFYLGLYDGKE
ncbi:hypothetical protein ACFL1R_05095 [Candidatus Latescibacterota bacterium]